MQNRITDTLGKGQSPAVARENRRYLIALAAFLLSNVAVPVMAQTAPGMKLAAERSFTVVPDVSTPIVLKTLPDAVCDLHGEGAGANGSGMKFYANGEGYLKIHARI